MTDNKLQKMKQIERKMLLVGIIDFPGSLLFGLGLYGIFVGFGNDFLPMLADQTIVYSMLAVGGAIMVWGGVNMFKLGMEKKRLLATDI